MKIDGYSVIIIDSFIESWFSPRFIRIFSVVHLQSLIWLKSSLRQRWEALGFPVTLGGARALQPLSTQRDLFALRGHFSFPAMRGTSALLFLIICFFFFLIVCFFFFKYIWKNCFSSLGWSQNPQKPENDVQVGRNLSSFWVPSNVIKY